MIYLITYLIGSILQYFLWRNYHRRYKKWTKGDRIFTLTIGFFVSWASIVWYIADVVNLNMDFDKEAKW